MGHAVRANYLYAGVADVYAETGESILKENLESIWEDIVTRKMYITGACGALYDGTSPDGTNYTPDSIQKVHQSYGRAYQLPNSTAHNETCANIGNVLFNWRMLQITGEEKYADVLETALYNSVLSGISLDGKRYFYTNPLRVSKKFPYTLRWSKQREEYIALCNCCPPNTVRTLCEVGNYAYSVSDAALWFHLYSGNKLDIKLSDGSAIQLIQITDYPWEGNIRVQIQKAPRNKDVAFYMRIPQWSRGYTLKVNGKPIESAAGSGLYVKIARRCNKDDVLELALVMETELIESNPLVEETRNEIAVRRGPIVYCLESMDVDGNRLIDDVLIPADIQFIPRKTAIDNSPVVCLEGVAEILTNNPSWNNVLYRPLTKEKQKTLIRLVPYYAWGNREEGEMTVWMPLSR